MGFSSLAMIGSAIEGMSELNQKNEFHTCYAAVLDVSADCNLTNSFSTTLNELADQCYEDTLAANSQDPQEAVQVAEDHAQMTRTSSRMDQETGALNQLIQTLESKLQREGSFMQTVFSLQAPVNNFDTTMQGLLAQKMG